MVERRDRRDRPKRLARGVDLAGLAVGRQVAGKDLAIVVDAHLPGEGIDIIGPPAFIEGIGQRDAQFRRDDRRKLGLAVVDDARDVQEDLLPDVAPQLACSILCALR